MVKRLLKSFAKAALMLGLLATVSATILTPCATATVYAEGTAKWVRDSSGKRYQLANGNYVTNQMKRIGGAWYYFGEDSYMVKSQVRTVNNNEYYFGATGKRVSGWYVVDGETYYFQATGAKVKGWFTVSGNEYYFDGEDGHMHTDEWIDGKYVNEAGVYDANAASDTTLIAHFKVVDGKVMELVKGTEVKGTTVSEDGVHFTGDGTTAIKLGSSPYNITIEAVVDFDENNMTQAKAVYNTYDGTNGKIASFTLVKNGNNNFGIRANRLAVEPYQSNLIGVKSNFVNAKTGTNEYENLTTGDTFVALSGDVSNKTTIGQVNGSQSVNTLKDVKWYYRTAYGQIYLNNTHQIKDLKFYNVPRTAEQLMKDYKATGIARTVTSTVTGSDGLVGLGAADAWHFDENGKVIWDDSLKVNKPGVYTGTTTDGTQKKYAIGEFAGMPGAAVNNSVFEGIHITNKLPEIYLGKQYSLTAYPHPFTGSENFDVEWTSSNNGVVRIIDGLVIAESLGSATITATLRGTDMSDSFEMTVVPAPVVEDVLFTVPEGYTSANGHVLNSEDRQDSMWAIYDAITEASQNGYTHIHFPYAVYASAIEKDMPFYYIPSNMTIEFDELHMVWQEYMSKNHEFHIFEFGVPKSDSVNWCENSNLIVHQYYGERYDDFADDGSVTEGNYIEEIRFAEFGRRAYNCSIQVENAQYPAGYFVTVEGNSPTNKTEGVITYDNLVSGRLDDYGTIYEDSNWISTPEYVKVPESVKTAGYFVSNNGQSSYAAKFWRGCTARLMDVQWYDESYNLISTDRFLGTVEYYKAPEGAAYFKLSLQQSALPSGNAGAAWLAMHDDGSAKFCELKNTYVYNSATGMFSVVGECDGLWIHHNYIGSNGTKPGDERTGDFENGWLMMRHSVLSNNVMAGKTFTAYASGGVGAVLHTNYFGNEVYTRTIDEQTRIINNHATSWICAVTDVMDFYYNSNYNFLFNSSVGSLKGWKCAGTLHYKYNPGGWLNRQ